MTVPLSKEREKEIRETVPEWRQDWWTHNVRDLLAELERLRAERDDLLFWNERVRTCAEHTQDVAAPVSDCLICTVDRLRADQETHKAQLEAQLEVVTEMYDRVHAERDAARADLAELTKAGADMYDRIECDWTGGCRSEKTEGHACLSCAAKDEWRAVLARLRAGADQETGT